MKLGELRTLFRIYTTGAEKKRIGSVQATWTEGSTVWGGLVPAYLTARSYGAGESPGGTREIELMPGHSIDERTGLEAIAGPEVGTKWRVIAVDGSDPHRCKARVEPFTGSFA